MPDVNVLIQAWARELAQALEMMTGESYRPSQPRPNSPDMSGVLWWRQEFNVAPGAALLVGAEVHVWNEVGARVLRGAGIEFVEQSEARSTWFEILQQASAGAARALNRKESPFECGGSGEIVSPAPASTFALTVAAPDGVELELTLALSPELESFLTGPAPAKVVADPEAPAAGPRTGAAVTAGSTPSRTMDALLDVELHVSLSFGQSALPLKDVLKLTTGSVIELNRQPEEPVEVIVNDRVIARGEVVVVEGNYAVRIHEIVSRKQRLDLGDRKTYGVNR